VAPSHSSASCAAADSWPRDPRWPFHAGLVLFAATISVSCALVSVAVEHASEVPFQCPESHSLEGSFRAGAHWCAREFDGRKRIDGQFVTWTGRSFEDGEPGKRRVAAYRAGIKHGSFVEYARPAPDQVQGHLELVGEYAWGRPVGVWRYFDHTGALSRVTEYGRPGN
jgi:hypothetical protein